MRSFGKLLIASALITVSHAASAATYVFEARGTVSNIHSADRDFRTVANPSTSIALGDQFGIRFNLDPTDAVPTSFYDADPTVNIYYWSVTNLVLSAGSYTTRPDAGEKTFASFQLWNNRESGGSFVDSFTLATLRYLPSGGSPVDLGAGRVNSQFHFSGFDFTAKARNSDLLTELPPLSTYGSQSAFFGFFNGDTYLQTNFQMNLTGASLTAVPEPASWALMIVGFGAMGAGLRRTTKRRATLSAAA